MISNVLWKDCLKSKINIKFCCLSKVSLKFVILISGTTKRSDKDFEGWEATQVGIIGGTVWPEHHWDATKTECPPWWESDGKY